MAASDGTRATRRDSPHPQGSWGRRRALQAAAVHGTLVANAVMGFERWIGGRARPALKLLLHPLQPLRLQCRESSALEGI